MTLASFFQRVAQKYLYWTSGRWCDALMQVRDTDVFLTSYPKSGNTWMRFMLADLLYGDARAVNFDTLESLIPEVGLHPASAIDAHAPTSEHASCLRILKSHAPLSLRFPRVIYIVRDPRDVAVSFYYYRVKRGIVSSEYPIDDHVDDFLSGLHTYGSWREHVGGWTGARGKQASFHCLRYEDMQIDALSALQETAEFLGLSPSEEQIQRAVERSSADRMRSMESTSQKRKVALLQGGDDIPFVRSATSGGWEEELPPASASKIVDAFDSLMRRFDYL